MVLRSAIWRDLALTLAASCVLVHSGQVPTAKGQGSGAEPDEEVYDVGPGVTAPRVIKQVAPQYSTKHGVRVVGSVLIGLIVSSHGIPRDPQILKGLDKEIDQSALDAVQQWRFAPGQKDRKPVAVRISLEIDFHSM